MGEITQSELKRVLRYNKRTGVWTWRKGTKFAGKVAGSIDEKGYRRIGIKGKVYKSHRLAFLYVLGRWPEDQVDHEDLDKDNGRWRNLREADNGKNNFNRPKPPTNTSGFKGVQWRRDRSCWCAVIYVNKKHIRKSGIATAEQAAMVYADLVQKYTDGFGRLA